MKNITLILLAILGLLVAVFNEKSFRFVVLLLLTTAVLMIIQLQIMIGE